MALTPATAAPSYWAHGVMGQITALNRNDNWAQLHASCVVMINSDDPDGSLNGVHSGTFEFDLDATGTGQSRQQGIAADNQCHEGHMTHAPAPIDVVCAMTGGPQKTTQGYETGTTSANQMTATGAAHDAPGGSLPGGRRWKQKNQTFDEKYFRVSLTTTEEKCTAGTLPYFPEWPHPDPPPPPPGTAQSPPKPQPPIPPPPKGTATFSGLGVNPPACFESKAAQQAFLDHLADAYNSYSSATHSGGAQEQANVQYALAQLVAATWKVISTPICPAPVPAMTTTGPKPNPAPQKKKGFFENIFDHVSIGVGSGGDHHDSRPSNKPHTTDSSSHSPDAPHD